MNASEMIVTASGTSVGLTGTISISGTQFTQQGMVQLCLMCGLSGNALIPVRCDSTGRIGSIV
jgi:hypothetical protein